MDNITLLEQFYKKYINDLAFWIPEGIREVDLKLLNELTLLDSNKENIRDPSLTRYFHVIETVEKITLINDDFVVWIVPDIKESVAVTYTLIALNKPDAPHLECAFSTSGVYNTSRLVLRVLEKILLEIQENEDTLAKIQKDKS